MTKNDVVVLLRAFKRMEIIDSNGFWIYRTKTAKELNVSEDIFNILISIVEHHNILYHFYPNYVTYSPDSIGGGENFSKYTTVGYFFTGETGSQHMVNINGIIPFPDSSVVSYFDAQYDFESYEYLNNFSVIYKLK